MTSTVVAQDVALDAIVRVKTRGQTEKGTYIRIGTGFLVGDAYILTARHLVRPEARWSIDEITGLPRYSINISMRDRDGALTEIGERLL